MKMKIISSAKIKLTLWFMGTLALIVIIFSFVLYFSMTESLLNGLDSSMEAIAKNLHNDIMKGVMYTPDGRIDMGEIEDIEELDEVKNVFPLSYMQLLELHDKGTRRDMKIVVKSYNLEDNTLPFPQFENKGEIKIIFKDVTDNRLADSRIRLLTYPFEIEENMYYVLQFAVTRKEVDRTINMLLMTILVVDPIVLIFSFFGGYFLVNKTLSPVRSVVASAKKITAEDLSHRIPSIGSKDEIGELVDTFNDMIVRLDRSIRKIRQFSSNVSHEFKSPLTVIRGEIDLALRKKRLKYDLVKTLESVGEEVITLQRIIDTLLFLGSTETDGEPVTFKKVPLDKIILDTFETIQQTAVQKNVRFVLNDIPTMNIEGEEILLKRMFFNLFENAVKYTPAGGRVEIRLENDAHSAKFTITDTGIGIPEDDIPFIFARFYRVDKARSRRMGSTGLGLSIVKRIARLHNGEIDVTSTPGKGSTFIVRLPLTG
jgi:signal transduction histidine kinase